MGGLRYLGLIFYDFSKFKKICIGKYLSSKVRGGGTILGDTVCSHLENVYIGAGSFINGGQICAGSNSRIVIGENCMISYGVHLRTQYHYYTRRDVPMNEQGMGEADIIIGNNVWIGYGVQIMSGVRIGTGSVIGAGAIVTKDIPANVLACGIPARIIKEL